MAEKAPKKTKKAESKPAKDTSAATSAAPETSSNDNSTAASSSGSSGSGGSREISYFSSVSSNDYRNGWDAIFSGNSEAGAKPKASKKPAATSRTETNAAGKVITLSEKDLPADIWHGLQAAFRKKARRRRLDFDTLVDAGRVDFEIKCNVKPE